MSQEVLNIILSGDSIIVTGLASWGGGVLISWMNSKIKDQTLAKHLTTVTQIVTDAVMNVFQSFVETLKANGNFDESAQKEAKERAYAIIMEQMTPELIDYVKDNYGELESWINNKIESVIYTLKSTNKLAIKKA